MLSPAISPLLDSIRHLPTHKGRGHTLEELTQNASSVPKVGADLEGSGIRASELYTHSNEIYDELQHGLQHGQILGEAFNESPQVLPCDSHCPSRKLHAWLNC